MRAGGSVRFPVLSLSAVAVAFSLGSTEVSAQSASAVLTVSAVVTSSCAVENARPAAPAAKATDVSVRCNGIRPGAVAARMNSAPPARTTILGPHGVRLHAAPTGGGSVLAIEF